MRVQTQPTHPEDPKSHTPPRTTTVAIVVMALTMLALAGAANFSPFAAARQDTASTATTTSADSGVDAVVEARDVVVEDQLARDWMLAQQRLNRSDLDERAATARSELEIMAADALAIQVRLGQLELQMADQESLLTTVHRERAATEAERSRVHQSIVDSQATIDALQQALTERAIAAYMVPASDYKGELLVAESVLDSEEKRILISAVVGSDAELVTAVEAEQVLLLEQQQNMDRLVREAGERVDHETRMSESLNRNRNEFEALQQLLDERIAARASEIEALEAASTELEEIMEARAQRLRMETEERNRIRELCRHEHSDDESFDAQTVEGAEGVLHSCARVFDAPPPTSLWWPTAGGVSSGFGMRWGRMHQGLDIGGVFGDQIVAAESGEVYFTGWISGYGKTVLIDHGGGMTTLYAHQSVITAAVGDQVNRGDKIGEIGSTGRSTGPHLHFEVQLESVAVDPMEYLF